MYNQRIGWINTVGSDPFEEALARVIEQEGVYAGEAMDETHNLIVEEEEYHMHKPPSRMQVKAGRAMPLWAWREAHIPVEGLWQHYFHCTKCGWERRKIDLCRYCDRIMLEVGAMPILREEGNVKVFKVNVPKEEGPQVKEERTTESGIKVFRVDVQ